MQNALAPANRGSPIRWKSTRHVISLCQDYCNSIELAEMHEMLVAPSSICFKGPALLTSFQRQRSQWLA